MERLLPEKNIRDKFALEPRLCGAFHPCAQTLPRQIETKSWRRLPNKRHGMRSLHSYSLRRGRYVHFSSTYPRMRTGKLCLRLRFRRRCAANDLSITTCRTNATTSDSRSIWTNCIFPASSHCGRTGCADARQLDECRNVGGFAWRLVRSHLLRFGEFLERRHRSDNIRNGGVLASGCSWGRS